MIKDIISGIRAYIGAFKIISQLKLWRYFAVPIFISIVTALIIFSTAFGLSDNIGHFISKIWIWEWGKTAFASVSSIIGGLFILVIGIILFKHIIMALASPFMSPVSEKIETYITGKPVKYESNTTFVQQLSRGIRVNGRNLLMELCITLPILLLKFIPVINIFSTLLLFLVQAYYAGFGNMDYTLERYFNYNNSLAFVRKHRGIAIGNGIVFILCLLIPVVGVIIVLPLSVTAATTQTVKQLQKQSL